MDYQQFTCLLFGASFVPIKSSEVNYPKTIEEKYTMPQDKSSKKSFSRIILRVKVSVSN